MSSAVPVSHTKATRMNKADRRRQILSVALDVFVRQGYHRGSMDDIAEAANISKPAVYLHFKSKRELYIGLLEEHLNTLSENLQAALASTQNNRERVRATMAAYFNFAGEQEAAHRLVFESDLNGDPEVHRMLEQFHEQFAKAISDVIAADTQLSQEESMVLGSGLCGLATNGTLQWLRSGQKVPQQQAVDLIYHLAWRGISRFPKES